MINRRLSVPCHGHAIMSRKRDMATPLVAPQPDNTVAGAAATLARLDDSELERALWNRVRGSPEDRLPSLGRDEHPADILLDVARRDEYAPLAKRFRASCARLLEQRSGAKVLEDPPALGELCFLAARIGADEAVSALTSLLERCRTESVSVWEGETLRLRTLRALVGLLARNRERLEPSRHRALLESCLVSADCWLMASPR
jgi:hypothetical protein